MTLKMALDKRDELATETAKGKSPAAERRLARAGLDTNSM